MQPQDIQKILASHLPDSQISVEGDDGQHFAAVIVSPAFRGKSRVEQQQMIYTALGSHITSGNIHALSLKTYTPEEYQQR